MPSDRFFYDSTFEAGETIALDSSESQHLCKVMRANVGDLIEIINGQGALAKGIFKSYGNKKELTAFIKIVTIQYAPLPPSCILAQAMVRPQRLQFILEKGVELGLTELRLFEGEHSQISLPKEESIARMRAVMIAAMKQSGNLFLPKILLFPPLLKWKKTSAFLFYGDPFQGTPDIPKDEIKLQNAIGIVGPEGGFSEQELKHLKSLNASPLLFSPHILRAETAALVYLALIQYHRLFSNN